MTRFAILPLGTGEFFTRRYYNSNFLVLLGDARVQVDCPEPYRRMLHEGTTAAGMPLDLGDINDVILTHLHGDHCNGLEGLLLWKFYAERRRLRLYTSPEVLEDLWAKLRGSLSWKLNGQGELHRHYSLEDYVDLTLWPFGSTHELYGATIETRRTNHPLYTFGLKIRFDGRTLGYSCDTPFDPGLIEWLSDCDMIIHETNVPPPHTAYEELLTVDPEIRARMRLIHFSDDFDTAKSAIRPLEQGKMLEIVRA